MYQPWGYHPLDIDDVVNDRYRVIQLLGIGSQSMVWVCEDLKAAKTGPRLVSLKIARPLLVDVEIDDLTTNQREMIGMEVAILRRIMEFKRTPPADGYPTGARFVTDFYDDFLIKGPNGIHQCIVLEFCGPSLGDLLPPLTHNPPVGLMRKLAVQLAQAVAFLQGCDIGHGDLHLGNILVTPRRLRDWAPEDVEEALGEPDTIGGNPGPPHGPRNEVIRIYSGRWAYFMGLNEPDTCDYSDFELRLTDFGESFITNPLPPPVYRGIPPVLAPPEVLLHKLYVHVTQVEYDSDDKDSGLAEDDDKEGLYGEQVGKDGKKDITIKDAGEDAKKEMSSQPARRVPPNFHTVIKHLRLPAARPFLRINRRSDLWSLGATLYELIPARGPLFGLFGTPRTAENVLYEIGVVFGVELFVNITEGSEDREGEINEASMEDRVPACRLGENFGRVVIGLTKVNPEDRLDAVEAVKLLEEAWPESHVTTGASGEVEDGHPVDNVEGSADGDPGTSTGGTGEESAGAEGGAVGEREGRAETAPQPTKELALSTGTTGILSVHLWGPYWARSVWKYAVAVPAATVVRVSSVTAYVFLGTWKR